MTNPNPNPNHLPAAQPNDVLRYEIEELLREAKSVKSSAELVGASARANREAGKIEAFQAVLGLIRGNAVEVRTDR